MQNYRIRSILTVLLSCAAALLLPCHALAASQPLDEQPRYDTVKVGLYYGASAITEARLENEIGSGYLFGWFDEEREFHRLGYTNVTALTVTADLNMTTEKGAELGCYHILLPIPYSSFADAKAKAEEIGGFPAYYSGEYFALFGQYQSVGEAEAALTASDLPGVVYTASNRCVVVTETGTSRILFEFDCGSVHSLGIRPVCETEKAVTWFKQQKYYGDFQYTRLSGDEYLTVVNYVGLEDYTKGVVPYEMPAGWHPEALKAQALCARNFVVTSFNRYRAHGFDVTADTYSQVYRGISDFESINRAVDATTGQYIRYQGTICQTYFFSSDGGATESAEYVWSHGVPYLMGVEDIYEKDVETGSEEWSYSMTPQELTDQLNERMGCGLNTIASVECEYTAMNNVKALLLTDCDGKTFSVKNNRCVYAVGANSPRFTIHQDEDGNYVVSGSGWGHNCGMSQYGARSMAQYHDKTAEEIIKFYYTGVYIR